MIPILLNHDSSKPIGWLRIDGAHLVVEFTDDVPITKEMFFKIFGNTGMVATQFEMHGGAMWIKKAQITEFSWSPTPCIAKETP